MGTNSTSPSAQAGLDAQLQDLISEAVVWSEDAIRRAETIRQIVSCAVDADHWRLLPEDNTAEEQSLRLVLDAANHHLRRMQTERDAGRPGKSETKAER